MRVLGARKGEEGELDEPLCLQASATPVGSTTSSYLTLPPTLSPSLLYLYFLLFLLVIIVSGCVLSTQDLRPSALVQYKLYPTL